MGEIKRDVVQTVELTPDKSITDAIGRGHTLATAVADVIDNSLDAKAERILVRFIVEDDRLVAVRIRDDGDGMTPSVLLDAMTLGKRRRRDEQTLGHFGIGLKAASLSQALTLTVFTRSADAPPCAMRIHRGSFTGEVLDDRTSEDGYSWDARGPVSTGTVVEWRGLETISHSQIASERRSWLDRTITTLSHALGLTFHRLIQRQGIRLLIDTWDQKTHLAGPPRVIEARDPFHFTVTGMSGYPSVISASTTDGARLDAECFILPPRSDSPSVWLLGRHPAEWQGIYIYRNNRLLQAGGWLDVRPDDKRLRLARMRIDLTGPLERHLRLRHEKSGVTPTPEFTSALEAATNEAGLTLDRFRSDAQEVLRASNVRVSTIKPVVPVISGLPDRVKEAISDELGERNESPILVVWEMLGEERLFDMQLERHRIVFNLGYRAALGDDEVALVPTLVYLLLEHFFTKDFIRDSTRAQIEGWQKVASAAMLAQLGDDAYDPLANWSIASPTQTTDSLTSPIPAPPSVELRWAHLGQRGQIEGLDGADSVEVEYEAELEPLRPTSDMPRPAAATPPDSALLVEEASGGVSAPAATPPEAATPPAPSDPVSEPLPAPHQPIQRRANSERPPIHAQTGDQEIIALYRSGADIDTIGSIIGSEPQGVAMRLCALLLGLEGDDIDDENLAAMHGLPYTPSDREKILEMYRGGASVRRISDHLMRTPFAIGWQLLSSPKRPVEVPRKLIRRIDRALAPAAGTPVALQRTDEDAG